MKRDYGCAIVATSPTRWYRPEIDGLRAVAVLPVIFFHAQFHTFAGGYIGVDVFFVISGYLITNILLRELRAGNFSLLRFYERRARRILPALSVVLLLCIPFAWLTLTQWQLYDFFQAIGSTSIFSSNILFWLESGYFTDQSDSNPLLHMWSLAVEEQYYLFFPLFLAGVMWWTRRGQRSDISIALALAGVGSLSYVWMEVALRADPSGNFYLAPSRVWELIVGALCAVVMADFRPDPGTAAKNLLSAGGVAMIIWSVFVLDEATPFPSAITLVPVLGTALVVLFADQETATGKALSAKPLVAVGLISYSTYLWHLPLFVFARLSRLERLTTAMNLGLIALSLLLGYLSWRFVERPFRKPATGPLASQKIIFGLSAASIVFFLGISFVGQARDGFPGRFELTENQELYLDSKNSTSPEKRECQAQLGAGVARAYEDACQFGDQDAAPTFAILGDSHTPEIAYQLGEQLAPRGLNLRMHAYGGCGPLKDPTRPGPDGDDCVRWSNEILAALKADADTTTVVITYKLGKYLEGSSRGFYPDVPDAYAGDQRRVMEENVRSIVNGLAEAGKTVIFVHQVPELPKRIDSLIYHFMDQDDDRRIVGAQREWWTKRSAGMTALAATFDASVQVVETADIFCDESVCLAGEDGISYYRDDNHLTLHAAGFVVDEIMEIVGNELTG